MTRAEAAAITKAIEIIEAGRVEYGVRELRVILTDAGQRSPPMKLIEAREPRKKHR
jgi:hypothetical protein